MGLSGSNSSLDASGKSQMDPSGLVSNNSGEIALRVILCMHVFCNDAWYVPRLI